MKTQKEELVSSLATPASPADAAPVPVPSDAPTPDSQSSQHSADHSAEGSERLVYQQEYTQTAHVVSARHFINYHMCWGLVCAAEFGVLGLTMLTVFHTRLPEFSYVFFFFSLGSLMKLVVQTYFSLVDDVHFEAYFRSMFDAAGNALVFHGLHFFLAGVYPPQVLVALALTNLATYAIKLVVFRKTTHNYALEMLMGFEGCLYLVLAVRLGYPTEEFSLVALQILGTSVFYSLVYFVSALSFFLVLFAVVTLFRINQLNENECAGLAYLFVVWLVSTAFSAVVCLTLLGARPLVEQGVIRPYPLPYEGMPLQIESAGYASFIFAGILGLMCLAAQVNIKARILRRISHSNARKITFKRYFKDLRLNLINVSGNFFKRLTKDDPTTPESKAVDECVVCQTDPASYLFSPCNHCVLCDHCIQSFLEMQDKCPICKKDIRRSVHVVADRHNRFKADQAFKLTTE